MNDNHLYRKVGRRYYRAGMADFPPLDGVWLVHTDRSGRDMRQIAERIGDVPDPIRLASVERYRDVICRAILQNREWRHASAYDITTCILRAIDKATFDRET